MRLSVTLYLLQYFVCVSFKSDNANRLLLHVSVCTSSISDMSFNLWAPFVTIFHVRKQIDLLLTRSHDHTLQQVPGPNLTFSSEEVVPLVHQCQRLISQDHFLAPYSTIAALRETVDINSNVQQSSHILVNVNVLKWVMIPCHSTWTTNAQHFCSKSAQNAEHYW